MHFGQYDLTIASPGISDRPDANQNTWINTRTRQRQHPTKYKTLTHRQHRLALAVNARTMAEVAALVFLDHLRDAAIGQNVPGMDQTIQHLGRLLDQVRLVRIVVQLVLCKAGKAEINMLMLSQSSKLFVLVGMVSGWGQQNHHHNENTINITFNPHSTSFCCIVYIC